MEKNVQCSLDNLVLIVRDVFPHTFDKLRLTVSHLEEMGHLPQCFYPIGKRRADYHYNIRIGQGSGAIAIGFKHNAKPEREQTYDMRIETNPNKSKDVHKPFWEAFREIFETHHKHIKQLDLAFDVPLPRQQLFVSSLTGKDTDYLKDTRYFGAPAKHGRLKVYDKQKELLAKFSKGEPVDVPETPLTRIEFTHKYDEAVTLQIFEKQRPDINSLYSVSVLDLESVTGELRACIIAILHGYMKPNEFTRTTKQNIKKAQENMSKVDLDNILMSNEKNILKQIQKLILG